jgi:Uncharacterized enzyme of heme biosynthesis
MQRVQSALQKTPNSALLYVIESKVYVAQREWDQAEATLLKALTLDPNYSPAYDLLISTYVATNKLPQALNQIQTALAKRPDDPQLLMTLGAIYEKQKDPLKARDAYEKLLTKNPEFVPALNNLAYLYADKLNNVDKAYKLARKARDLRSDPRSPILWVGSFTKRGIINRPRHYSRKAPASCPRIPTSSFISVWPVI